MNIRLMIAGSARVLIRYRLRSFFMSLGVVIGVAALVVMRSVGTGAEQEMMDRMEKLFSAGSIMVVNSPSATHGGGRERGKLTIEDIEAVGAQVPRVIDWTPSVYVGSREVLFDGQSRSLMIVGESERAEEVWNRGVIDGEFFTRSDVQSAARVALLGPKTAVALFGDEDPTGRTIQIDKSPYRVKGVLEEHGMDPHGMDRDDEVHIPITTLMQRLVQTDAIGSAKLIISDLEAVDETVDEVTGVLRDRHGLADDERDDFSIFTPRQVRKAVKEVNRVMTVYLPATAGIALLVAAIVIANIMLLAVRERIPEIGLRKAVGATSRQIGFQFLLESLTITMVSGGLGAALGAGLLLIVASHTGLEAGVAPDAIPLGFGAALLVGLVAGVFPARQAARLEPVDALR